MPDTFYDGVAYECASEPYLMRKAVTCDLWPEGTDSVSGTKDTLTAGEHPFLAIGARANRPHNVVGVVVDYESLTDMATLNIAPGFIARNYLVNITGYGPTTYAATVDKHQPVWIDDSAFTEGCTLSLSNANSAGADNPLAGYTWPAQDEWDDSGVGGGNSDAYPKSFTAGDAEYYLTTCVLLWPNNED